jgi:hypothetical protein
MNSKSPCETPNEAREVATSSGKTLQQQQHTNTQLYSSAPMQAFALWLVWTIWTASL